MPRTAIPLIQCLNWSVFSLGASELTLVFNLFAFWGVSILCAGMFAAYLVYVRAKKSQEVYRSMIVYTVLLIIMKWIFYQFVVHPFPSEMLQVQAVSIILLAAAGFITSTFLRKLNAA